MKTFWKALMGLMISLPMLAYVSGALIAAQQDPPQYDVVMLRPAEGSLSTLTVLDPQVPDQLPDLTPAEVEAITPSPDDLDDESDDAGRDGWDGATAAGVDDPASPDSSGGGTRPEDDDDNSGPGGGDDDDSNSGSGSGKDDDDDSNSGSGSGSGKDDDDTDDRDDDSEPDND